jgi:hypothetical protein
VRVAAHIRLKSNCAIFEPGGDMRSTPEGLRATGGQCHPAVHDTHNNRRRGLNPSLNGDALSPSKGRRNETDDPGNISSYNDKT